MMSYLAALLSMSSLLAIAPPTTGPLKVEAWRGTGKHELRDTTTLSQLTDFSPEPVELDRYGGWVHGDVQKKTGFFYVTTVGKRSWLVTPEGHPYLNIGVNTVSTGDRTPGEGWRFSSEAAWRDQTLSYLKSLGFNGTGAWSRDALLASAPESRMPYTPIWNFMSSYGHERGGTYQQPGHTGYPNDCIFVFDPEFARFCDKHARQLEATKDDPYLFGHFTDNELPFPNNMLERYLQLPESDPGYQAAKDWILKHRKGGPATQPWGAPYSADEREGFRGFVAETYYRAVTTAIRKHDPNHLILGSRLHANELSSPTVFAAAGRYLDVIAINYYNAWTPRKEQFDHWWSWSGKPVLITEWYAKGADSGFKNLTGAGFTVPTQTDRGYYYQNFTLGLLAQPHVVGWHWFKYVDNDPNDPKADPSNRDSNKGIVTIEQKPYEPLAKAMKELNTEAYPLTGYFDSK